MFPTYSLDVGQPDGVLDPSPHPHPLRVVDSVDVDPSPDLLRAVLSIRSLLGLTAQVEGEQSGLRVDVDAVVVLQVEEEVAVDLKAYL